MDDNLDGILKITILDTHKGRPTFHYTNLQVGFEYIKAGGTKLCKLIAHELQLLYVTYHFNVL